MHFRRQDNPNPVIGYVGSSNLTSAGLNRNYEPNVDVLDYTTAGGSRAVVRGPMERQVFAEADLGPATSWRCTQAACRLSHTRNVLLGPK
jgi:hypothetical protein